MAVRKSKNTPGAAGLPGLAEWTRIKVPLIKLHLDLHNPRHEPAANEAQAIELLYADEKVAVVAADIVAQRAMSPLDMIGVIAMPGNPGHYIAVEGNRRLCALLLLNDPERAPGPAERAAMQQLASQVQLPEALEVVVFDSRDDSRSWISLRHLGPQEGQGLKPWTAGQKSRATEGGGENALAGAVLDRAAAGEWLGDAAPPAVTTLTRALKSREVRAALGLAHHRSLEFTHDSDEVDTALKQFLRDALPTGTDEKPRVNSRASAQDQAAYAREFRTRGFAPTTALPAPQVPAPAEPAPKIGSKAARNLPDPGKRKCLVPTGFVCNAKDDNLRRFFHEFKQMPIDGHEYASAYMLRAFAEWIMCLYIKEVVPGFTLTNDRALVQACADQLDPTGNNPKFKPIRTAASATHASHSFHTLGAAVHGSIHKDRRALISAWGNWDHALRTMLLKISKA